MSPDRTQRSQRVIEQPIDMDKYFEQTGYNGESELIKENQLTDFFKQKYYRVNNYLRQAERETEKAATKARSSIRNYGTKLLIEQSMIQKFQGELAANQARKRQAAAAA